MEELTKQELLKGDIEYRSEAGDLLEVTYNDQAPNWAGAFALRFNARYQSFKTLQGLRNRVIHLIKVYKLERDYGQFGY